MRNVMVLSGYPFNLSRMDPEGVGKMENHTCTQRERPSKGSVVGNTKAAAVLCGIP